MFIFLKIFLKSYVLVLARSIKIIKIKIQQSLILLSLFCLAGCVRTSPKLTLTKSQQSQYLTLQRVILASDANPTYLEFWPYTAKIWQQITGLRPTLILVADESVTIDESHGDVIRFIPIAGIPTHLQAQTIRLLAPALFPQEGCLISDIDMIPLKKAYFIDTVARVPVDGFAVYRNLAYKEDYDNRYPMCYNAAQGHVFAEIFGVTGSTQAEKLASIRNIITCWAQLNLGWHTDEICLIIYLQQWSKHDTHCIKLDTDQNYGPRVDRADWSYEAEKVQAGYYTDSHMLRPYSQHKAKLDQLAVHLGVKL